MLQAVEGVGKRALARLHAVWTRWRRARVRRRIGPILQQPGPPRFLDAHELDAEATFWKLYREAKPRTRYRYDSFSLWKRGAKRALALLERTGLHEPSARVLEVGCGDGTTGYVLRCYGHEVTLTDLEDWRDERARNMPFLRGDVCAGLEAVSGQFDLVYSYNTFEHVEDPEAALNEVVRLCKPGGYVHLKFGPLYPSAWGLHAYKTIPIPFLQYLFSPGFVAEKLQGLGIRDLGREREALQPMNRWRVRQFERLWDRPDCEVVASSRHERLEGLEMIRRFQSAFAGRELTFEDVVTKNLNVTLQKRR